MGPEKELKHAVDLLGERLRNALAQDAEIIRLVRAIQQHGMNLTVILEAYPAGKDTEPDEFSDFDRRFLKNLRIRLADDNHETSDWTDA